MQRLKGANPQMVKNLEIAVSRRPEELFLEAFVKNLVLEIFVGKLVVELSAAICSVLVLG